MSKWYVPYTNRGEYSDVKLINGGYTHIRTDQLIGYCHCMAHKGFLSKTLLHTHECIDKQCPFLERFEDYPFWHNYYKYEKKKQDTKNAKKLRKERERLEAEFLEAIKAKAQHIADGGGMEILITQVIRKGDPHSPKYIIYYVSKAKTEDEVCYLPIANKLHKTYDKPFYLKHMKLPNGSYATVDDWKATAYLRK